MNYFCDCSTNCPRLFAFARTTNFSLYTLVLLYGAASLTNYISSTLNCCLFTQSWQPHGRAFKIHDRKRFATEVMPRFFKQSKFSSFTRQLRIYGFSRISCPGPDKGAYYHEACLRGMFSLSANVQKLPKECTSNLMVLSPTQEPDFHDMPHAPPTNR